MDLSRRVDLLERMDNETISTETMRDALRFLSITNRFFGGARVVLSKFQRWSAAWPKDRAIRILDIGTGAADIPIAIARWARVADVDVAVTAIDLMPDIVALAQQNTRSFSNIQVRQENFFDVRERGETFDYVTASLLLHHVAPAETIRALQAFDRLAKRGVIVSDLLRTKQSYFAVTALSALIGNSIVRHDGPLSVRRAFTADELTALAKEARLPYLRAHLEPWFRVSLAGEKSR